MATKEKQATCSSLPEGSGDEESPNLFPFQSVSNSSESSGDEEQYTYTKNEGIREMIPTSPTNDTVASHCEIGFGEVLPEDEQIDIVRNAVFSVASNLMEMVGMSKVEDDELSNNTSELFGKTNGLDTEEVPSYKRQSSIDSYSIPPEIEMLHMEAELLLESIRYGVSPEVLANSPKKTREGVNDFLDKDGVEDYLQQKQYNFDDLDDKDDKDEIMSISSFLTDDDGMRGEIQNLGSSVSNLRRDLEKFSRYDDCGSFSGMTQASVLAAKHSGLRETWSRALKDILFSIKTLRRMGNSNANVSSLEGKSRLRDMVHDWSSTILWSAAIFMAGAYFKASCTTENEYNELEGFDMLENLEWMFAKEEQHELAVDA